MFVGAFAGACVRVFVGAFVGVFVGIFVGAFVGAFVGVFVGAVVGVFVGFFVGAFVGASQAGTSSTEPPKARPKELATAFWPGLHMMSPTLAAPPQPLTQLPLMILAVVVHTAPFQSLMQQIFVIPADAVQADGTVSNVYPKGHVVGAGVGAEVGAGVDATHVPVESRICPLGHGALQNPPEQTGLSDGHSLADKHDVCFCHVWNWFKPTPVNEVHVPYSEHAPS